jgi:hypothetical protein
MIQEGDLERALAAAEASGRTLGETIVEMGLLRPEQIQVEAARRTRLVVESVLDWDSGQYSFEEREERLDGELPSEIDVPEVLLGWARNARSAEMVRRVLADGKAVLHRAEKLSARLAGLRLSTAEQWALDQANGVYPPPRSRPSARWARPRRCEPRADCSWRGSSRWARPRPLGRHAGLFTPSAARRWHGLWATLEAERNDVGQTTRLATPAAGARRYVVEQAIGRGSMGAVCSPATAIDRRVAVKLIQTSVQLTPPEWEKYKERFYREARAAGKLLHQGIVAIFDVGHTVEGIPFIVMEYVEGRTLAALAQDKELPLEQVLRLSRECLDALEYAHSQGVVHRDLKPANIMITADGRPKIMDFGVAHVVGSQMTQADEILGSPHFMAPEQLGKGKVDQRTDLFAFGVVLYWMLTGQLPFTGDSFAAIAQAVLSERPVSPKDLKRHVSRPLGKIVLRCLEKDPAKRFATASELRKALRAVEEPPRDSRRSVILGLLLLAAVGWLLLFLNRTPASRARHGATGRRADGHGPADAARERHGDRAAREGDGGARAARERDGGVGCARELGRGALQEVAAAHVHGEAQPPHRQLHREPAARRLGRRVPLARARPLALAIQRDPRGEAG